MKRDPESRKGRALRGRVSRRGFLASAGKIVAGAATLTIIPREVLGGPGAPSERIGFGFVGVGRMAQGHLSHFGRSNQVQVRAVCDVDANRREAATKRFNDCAAYGDFRELLAREDVDAVVIATPDHWHVPVAIAAARAGKDFYVEKPLTLTISEGRALSDAVRRYGCVAQVGSQQRSDGRFRHSCELVRNGRIGELKTVEVGFGADPGGKVWPPERVPEQLDYDFWLGQAPWKPYTGNRVHPQRGYGRPGWLRIRDYGSGMVTGWGAHHLDIAQWGIGAEGSGPVEVSGRATYPTDGLWDVATEFRYEYRYASGARVACSNSFRNGIKFVGTKGWVFVTRGRADAEPKSLLKSVIGPNELHLYRSEGHHANFLNCVRSRREPVAPIENGHRSATVCHLGHIATLLERPLRWDPGKERFVGDPEADRMISRPMREPWTL